MRIGYLSTIYHTSFILKSGNIEYKNSNETEWKLFPTGPAIMKAFKDKEIDLGYVGLPPVMIGIQNGMKLKCVAGGHIEGTVMIAKEEYDSYDDLGDMESVLKQFEGKSIGTPTRGSIHDVIIRNLLGNSDISINNYPWADFIPDAISENEIAAGVGTPSLATVSGMQLETKIIVPPNKLWPYNPSYGIVVQEDIIKEDEEFILSFIKAHEEACNLIRNQPELAAQTAAGEMGVVDKGFVLNTYNISPRYCAKIPEEYIKSTMDFLPVLKKLGYMNTDLKPEDIFELKYINQVHREPAHYY
jgi:NitT/TauT family transport system substrate-binding protein